MCKQTVRVAGCWLLVGVLTTVVGGCATRPPLEAPSSGPSVGESFLEQARRFASQGQSLRAEQYYLAAVDAGVPDADVFPLLVETCIESGRFRSALSHVEARLLEQPDSPALLKLSSALRQTLGLERARRDKEGGS